MCVYINIIIYKCIYKHLCECVLSECIQVKLLLITFAKHCNTNVYRK